MSKKNAITIDLDVWTTQAQYAIDNKKKLTTVSQWVKRAKAGKNQPVEYWEIPELNNLTLVKKPS